MILAIDTSSAACTAALFEGEHLLDARSDVIGRGHSERLVPMLAELLQDRTPSEILVGVGPGSFTGIRVGIAAAHGLAIGWGARLAGMSSLALLAASGDTPVAAAVKGGHGELFVQQFHALASPGPLRNLRPAEAAGMIDTELVVGSGAELLVAERGWGRAVDLCPSAGDAMRLPAVLRSLEPSPLYARAPDAKVLAAA